jgi:hypothetical protein
MLCEICALGRPQKFPPVGIKVRTLFLFLAASMSVSFFVIAALLLGGFP